MATKNDGPDLAPFDCRMTVGARNMGSLYFQD